MNKSELRSFYYEKTNFSPDAIAERAEHRYLASSTKGEQYPRGDAPDLGVFDVDRSRFLTHMEISALPFSDAMSQKKA